MKKTILLILSLIGLSLFLAMGFSACGSKNEKMTIKVTGGKEVYQVSEFNLSDYKLIITYIDGSIQETKLSMNYIRVSDREKLKYVGEHVITVEYGSAVTTFKVNLDGPEITGVVFNDKTATFNGRQIKITAENLPSGAKITYEGNNYAVNVGVYKIKAKISLVGYRDLEVEATLTITKAKVEKPTAIEQTVVYDGAEHNYGIENTVFYSVIGGVQKNAGKHTVIVRFHNADNCEWVDGGSEDLTFEFEIQKAKYDLTGVKFPNRAYLYDGLAHGVQVFGLPFGVNVEYSLNNKTEKGEYIIEARFYGDEQNYDAITQTKTANLVIADKDKLWSITFKQFGEEDRIFYVKKGESFDRVLRPAVRARTGYKVEWESADYSDITADMTVNAVFTPNNYQITVNENNGKENYKVNVQYNRPYTIETPIKQGFVFVEWTSSDGSVFASSGEYNVSGNVYVIAKWKEQPIKIRFENLTANEVSSCENYEFKEYSDGVYIEVEKGAFILPITPKKSGEAFCCFVSTDGKYVDLYKNAINEEMTVKAYYEPVTDGKNILTFVEENFVPIVKKVDAGSVITQNDLPKINVQKNGYTAEWNFDFSSPIDKNQMITVKYEPKIINVYYDIEKERISNDTIKLFELKYDDTRQMYYQQIVFGAERYYIVDKIKDNKYFLKEFRTERGITVKSGYNFAFYEDLLLKPILAEKSDWSSEK